MDEKQKAIEELAESISAFMDTIPGEDDRDWNSGEMAEFLYDAGYRLPVKENLSPISDTEIEKIRLKFIELQNEWHNNLPYKKGEIPEYPDYGKMIANAQLNADKKALGQ